MGRRYAELLVQFRAPTLRTRWSLGTSNQQLNLLLTTSTFVFVNRHLSSLFYGTCQDTLVGFQFSALKCFPYIP